MSTSQLQNCVLQLESAAAGFISLPQRDGRRPIAALKVSFEAAKPPQRRILFKSPCGRSKDAALQSANFGTIIIFIDIIAHLQIPVNML